MEGILVLFKSIVQDETFKACRIFPYNILLNTSAIYIRGFCTATGMLELDEYIRTYKTSGRGRGAKKKMAANQANVIKDRAA